MSESKPTVDRVSPGDQVRHGRFGRGTVQVDNGRTVLVRFDHGFEECERGSLVVVFSPIHALVRGQPHPQEETVARVQAAAIRSVNDRWGVFTRSRIELLPHQLWVCRQVIADWPVRRLVADDVGLGKTIEAGLILMPLLSAQRVRRVLVLCPASLVEQWQYRMRVLFDIRLTRYSVDADTPRSDFWGTQNQVVASLETLRADRNGRHQRILESDPWDLLVVDEAHRLNADEQAGPTLGFRFVHRLVEEDCVKSVVFFTGTPHRGKNYGFLSLLSLLRPDLFDPRRPVSEQLPQLRQVMIRNNKQNVTDLKGQRLFTPTDVRSETYQYSPAESHFYTMLTEFISSGKAYASSLASQTDRRAVMLVLIAMQKLASSSVAAIRRAMRGRLRRISQGRQKLDELNRIKESLSQYESAEAEGDEDVLSSLEERIAEESEQLHLMEDEEDQLRQLVAAADAVIEETKIRKLIDLVKGDYTGRSVLFFTEYKATQSLLMSHLMQDFGDDAVAFINGDERAEDVVGADRRSRAITMSREDAADRFNAGRVKFLISTEAGGEGIDLQESCHTLVHVDLPWNPMRMHQRVGRLNRYGQKHRVHVLIVRNPDTVEARIWDKLNDKIDQINRALAKAMDEPEDMLQLVLGMTSPTMFRDIFAEAPAVPAASLSNWFDQKTATFGGHDVIETVRELVGNCAKFDFQSVSAQIPRVDLPDLKPFVISMLSLNRRQVKESEDGQMISFLTPESWLTGPAVRVRYENMTFDRNERSRDSADRILGVGHRVVDQAIDQAIGFDACAAYVHSEKISKPLLVFRVTDRVTGQPALRGAAIFAAEVLDLEGATTRVLADWELLIRLNALGAVRTASRQVQSPAVSPIAETALARVVEAGRGVVLAELEKANIVYRVPDADLFAVIWPGKE